MLRAHGNSSRMGSQNLMQKKKSVNGFWTGFSTRSPGTRRPRRRPLANRRNIWMRKQLYFHDSAVGNLAPSGPFGMAILKKNEFSARSASPGDRGPQKMSRSRSSFGTRRNSHGSIVYVARPWLSDLTTDA